MSQPPLNIQSFRTRRVAGDNAIDVNLPSMNGSRSIISNESIYFPLSDQIIDTPTAQYINVKGSTSMRIDVNHKEQPEDLIMEIYNNTGDDVTTEYLYYTKYIKKNTHFSEQIPIKNDFMRIRYANLSSSNLFVNQVFNLSQYVAFNPNKQINKSIQNDEIVNINRVVNDFQSDIALDRNIDVTNRNKYGHVSNLVATNTQLFWNNTNDIYQTPTATTLTFASSNASDYNLDLILTGINQSGNEIIESISTNALDGTTPVTTTQEFWRLNEARCEFAQTDNKYDFTTNMGDINFYETGDATKIFNIIPNNSGKSSTVYYAVPLYHEIVIKSLQISGYSGNCEVRFKLFVCKSIIGGLNQLEYQIDVDDVNWFDKKVDNLNIKLTAGQEVFVCIETPDTATQENHFSCFLNIEEYFV